MTRGELLATLRGVPRFADLDDLDLHVLGGGFVSRHVYHLRHGGDDLVVKLAKPNEIKVQRALLPLGLGSLPPVVCPELLDRELLVTAFVPGGPLRDERLSDDLLADCAAFANHLPSRPEPSPEQAAPWQRYAHDCLVAARANLAWLEQHVTPDEAAQWDALLDDLRRRGDDEAAAFATMPHGWLHHDLRADNILVGPPQQIIDWGSSYGPGPFLFDLAPFLVQQAGEAYWSRSALAALGDADQRHRWLLVAARVRAAEFLAYLPEMAANWSPTRLRECLNHHDPELLMR